SSLLQLPIIANSSGVFQGSPLISCTLASPRALITITTKCFPWRIDKRLGNGEEAGSSPQELNGGFVPHCTACSFSYPTPKEILSGEHHYTSVVTKTVQISTLEGKVLQGTRPKPLVGHVGVPANVFLQLACGC
ncbi:hypothetical protein STEG23_014111, partial [Scotinomys teguina]